MGAVFAMQGFGQFTAAVVMICVVVGFKGSLESVRASGLLELSFAKWP